MKGFWRKLLRKKIVICLICVFLPGFSFALPGTEGIQIYQKNMHLSEEHKQKLAADIFRFYNANNMWDEIRHDFVLSHYEDNPQVQEQINFFLNHQDFLLNSAEHAAPYLYYILQQVRKRHLPGELVLLPMIESAYNPFAYSTAGAAGIWQMMPGTASGFGIKQNWWYDGRRDVVASTRAALDYLSYLGNFFGGNWLLAIAAYDTGEGNILSAIHKNIRDGYNTEFWSLPLSQETRIYIPRLLALATIISHPEQYPIIFPPVRNAPYLAQIDIGEQIQLKQAALLAGLSLKKLKQLNPGYSRSKTGPHGPFKLVLPIESVKQFTENLAMTKLELQPQKKSMSVLASALENVAQQSPNKKYSLQPGDTLYMVRNNDNLQKIANRFHMPVAKLMAVNQLRTQYDIRAGDKLMIPTHLAHSTLQKYQLTPGDTIYMVRGGDTIEKIAKRFHTSAISIRLANLLTTNVLQEGDRLVIPTHVG